MTDGPLEPSAKDLVRRRRRRYHAPDTGRQHHLGGPPEAVPLLGAEGLEWTATAAARLRELTVAQLQELADDLAGRMATASAELRFEDAAVVHGHLTTVRAEIALRDG